MHDLTFQTPLVSLPLIDEQCASEIYSLLPLVEAMNQAVLSSKVNGVFISDVAQLGTPKTGMWTHLHARLPTS